MSPTPTRRVCISATSIPANRPLPLPKGFDAVPTSWFPDSTHLLLSVLDLYDIHQDSIGDSTGRLENL